MKDQDVSHREVVTSGRARPCFAIPNAITQQRDRGNEAVVIWKSLKRANMKGEICEEVGKVSECHNKVGCQLGKPKELQECESKVN